MEKQLRENKLLKMQLEEDIEMQDEAKDKLQQKSMVARKQIARTIRKTQTFLSDQERLLKEKLLAVKSMNHEIMRLYKEREIIAAKKNEAQSAYYAAEAQRTQMRLHFERMQSQNDEDRAFNESFRKFRRDATFDLGKQVIMLSTKANDPDHIDAPDENLNEQNRLRMLTRELEMTQRRYMLAVSEKDFLKARKQAQLNTGNIKGNIVDSSVRLNMFTMDSERDVRQMKTEL